MDRNVLDTMLLKNIERGNRFFVKMLLLFGANPNGIEVAGSDRDLSILRYIYEFPLTLAIMKGHSSIAIDLIHSGADDSFAVSTFTPPELAILKRDFVLMASFEERGVDIECLSFDLALRCGLSSFPESDVWFSFLTDSDYLFCSVSSIGFWQSLMDSDIPTADIIILLEECGFHDHPALQKDILYYFFYAIPCGRLSLANYLYDNNTVLHRLTIREISLLDHLATQCKNTSSIREYFHDRGIMDAVTSDKREEFDSWSVRHFFAYSF